MTESPWAPGAIDREVRPEARSSCLPGLFRLLFAPRCAQGAAALPRACGRDFGIIGVLRLASSIAQVDSKLLEFVPPV